LEARRREQQVRWVWTMVQDRLLASLRDDPRVAELAPKVEQQVAEGTLTPALAAEEILAAFNRR
jgi:LAO/AO transport system kinase